MLIKRISFFDEFKCLAGDCPDCCCRGWKIPVDDKTYMKYLGQTGLLGTVLRCAIKKEDETVAFKNWHNKCPFWGTDRLCFLQKKYGLEYMPLVCIQFPRQLYNLGEFCEEILYLACPEAARLFLVHVDDETPLDFVETEGNPGYDPNTTNDDFDFLDYLVKSRNGLIKLLEDGCLYTDCAITGYALSAQNAMLSSKTPPSPFEFWDKDGAPLSTTLCCDYINKLMFNGFYHINLRQISPFMYKLCRKYIHEFGLLSKTNPLAADKKLAKLIDDLYDKIGNLSNILKRYYEYFLLSDFLDIYEDYSFSKHIKFGIDKTNLLLVFIALYAKDRRALSLDELARLIAVFERRAPQIR